MVYYINEMVEEVIIMLNEETKWIIINGKLMNCNRFVGNIVLVAVSEENMNKMLLNVCYSS